MGLLPDWRSRAPFTPWTAALHQLFAHEDKLLPSAEVQYVAAMPPDSHTVNQFGAVAAALGFVGPIKTVTAGTKRSKISLQSIVL
jgi:hypothetical protein